MASKQLHLPSSPITVEVEVEDGQHRLGNRDLLLHLVLVIDSVAAFFGRLGAGPVIRQEIISRIALMAGQANRVKGSLATLAASALDRPPSGVGVNGGVGITSLLFMNGFESGDTTGWSSSIP